MSLITREEKGSKLTIAEMDGNLTYLESNGFVDGEYSRTTQGTGAVLQMQPQGALDSAEGIYENISPTSGSGTGLIVDVEIASGGRGGLAAYFSIVDVEIIDGERGGKFAEYIIVDGGSGYAVGDTVSIQNTDIGGTTGTTDRELEDGDVDVTTTSTVTIGSNITISTPSLTISGSIVVTDTLQCDNISGTNISGQTLSVFTGGPSLSISVFGLQLSSLPTTEPVFPGYVWNDSGSLKISADSPIP
jgi:hypothetical protein